MKIFLFVLIVFFNLSASSLYTQQELNYIKSHPKVILGADYNWPPYEFVDYNGKYRGIAADIIALIEKKSGLKIEVTPDIWAKTVKKVKEHKIDGLTCAVKTPQREKYLLFTKPYVSIPIVIITTYNRGDISSLKDLKNKTVAINRGSYIEEWLRKNHPDINLFLAKSNASAIEAVVFGKADAYVGNMAVATYIMKKNFLTNLKIAGKIKGYNTKVSIAIDKQKPLLFSIINKTLNSIPKDQIEKIINKWYLSSKITEKNLFLTKEEIQYIKKHPVIRVGDGDSWAPVGFVKNGKYIGIAKDYLDLISQKTGLKFKMVIGNWSKFYEDMKENKSDSVDMLDTIQYVKGREKYFNFTPPYITLQKYFFIRKDIKAKSLKDLDGKTVAIPKHYNEIEFIKKYYPKIKILQTDSFLDAIDAVLTRKADLLLDDYEVVSYVLEKRGIFNIVPFKRAGNNAIDEMRMATKKSDPILASILTKAINSISDEEKREIYNKWVKYFKSEPLYVRLTQKEKEWLKKHPVLNFVVDPDWAPIEFIDDKGDYQGFAKDYLGLISKQTGLKFNLIKTKSWQESVSLVKSGKSDMFSCVKKTPEREKYLYFSKPYLVIPYVIVTRIDAPYIDDLDYFNGKSVAGIKDYAITEFVKKNFPGIKLILVNNIQEALNAVSKGKADAFVSLLPTASYNINKYGFVNLKIAGKLKENIKLSIAIRKNLGEEGINIINKALSHITQAEKQNIYNKWMTVKFNKEINYKKVLTVLIIAAIIISIIFYWALRLKKEIKYRKKIEKQLLIEKEKAEAANRAKSLFLSNMSHEIRTPMNAIMGFTQLLDEQLKDKKLKKYVNIIKNSGESLLTLINDILDLSKIEAGKLTIQKRPVNLHRLIEDVASVFTLKIQEKGIDFVIEDDKSIPDSLLLDEVRIRQVLVNLIGNAIKFTDKGYIKLKTRALAIKEHNSKVDLEISVEDTGIGIKKDQLNKIFGEFEQVEGQDNRKYGGTGLGLAISYRLAKMMGGDLSVKSEFGKGSVFTLKLYNVDISSVAQELEKSVEDKEIEFKKAKILVADDVSDNRELIVSNFENTPVEIITAVNGKDAIEKFKKYKPDLVLMDIRMPEIDGFTAAKEIKKISNVPIIALTASVMHDDLSDKRRSVFDGFLKKPVLKKLLFKEIARFLPHTYKESKTKKNEDNIKNDIKTLLLQNKDKVYNEFKKAKTSKSFNDIGLLYEKIKKLSKDLNNKNLEIFADKIKEAIDTFDILMIEKILSDLDEIFEN